ncbi:MAG TPA: hypothetical protein DEF30_04580, partial [Proteiniclasticum sp.]|uniref:hypothetical protein n=1 Tax=Proteiniclasticum sp. TaxID=2053595 RepID=UPI000E9908F6
MESSKLKETYEKQQYENQANFVYVNTIIIGAILVFIYFFVLQTYRVALANVLLLAVSYLSIKLNRKEQYALSSLIFITMVAFTAFLQIHEFGLRTGFQYFYLNLSGLVMFTNWKPWQKAAGTILLVSLFILSFGMSYQVSPPVELNYFWVFFLHTVNILLNVAGVANSANYKNCARMPIPSLPGFSRGLNGACNGILRFPVLVNGKSTRINVPVLLSTYQLEKL